MHKGLVVRLATAVPSGVYEFADSAITGVILVLPPVELIWMASSPINPTPVSTAMNDIK